MVMVVRRGGGRRARHGIGVVVQQGHAAACQRVAAGRRDQSPGAASSVPGTSARQSSSCQRTEACVEAAAAHGRRRGRRAGQST